MSIEIISLMILILIYYKEGKDFLRVDWLYLLKSSLAIFVAKSITLPIMGISVAVFNFINPVSLLSVYWEDVIFAIVPFIILRDCKSKIFHKIYTVLFIALIIYFGKCHLYQGARGWVAMVLPLVSIYIGTRKGFGTSMLLHISFDLISYFVYYTYIRCIVS